MGMKGQIKSGHMPANKAKIQFVGLPPITAINHSELDSMLEVVDLPDRTRASGGQKKPVDFDFDVPMHHKEEQAALEKWHLDCQDPVAPDYKKTGVLIFPSIMRGITAKTYSLSGSINKGPVIPAGDKTNEGEEAVVKWRISIDDVVPI